MIRALLRLLGFRRRRHIDTTPLWRGGIPRGEPTPQPYRWTPEVALKLKGFNK